MKLRNLKNEAEGIYLLLKVTRALKEDSILRASIQNAIKKKIPPVKILRGLKEQIDLGHRSTMSHLIGENLVNQIDNFKFEQK